MARFLVGVAVALLAAGGAAASPDPPEVRTLRIAWGSESGMGAEGRVSVSDGRILRLQGWGLQAGDAVGAGWSWHCSPGATGPRSLLVTVSAPRSAELRVATESRTLAFGLSDLAKDDGTAPLEGPVAVELLPTPRPLSQEHESDFPALASSERGGTWCGWIAFDGREDRIFLAQHVEGRWEARGALPRAQGKIHQLALAATPGGDLLAVWGEEKRGNWDLYAATLSRGRWSKPARVTRNPGADTNHRLASDPQGRVWLVWQAFEGSFSHIRLASWEGGRWSQQALLTDVPANHWAPTLAVSPEGIVYVAWDSAAAGSYDIYLRSLEDGRLSPARRVTSGPEYEANAALACEPGGRVWVAYDQGETGWGDERHAAELHRERRIGLRCLEGERVRQPPLPPTGALTGVADFAETPSLHVDGRGLVWMAYRRTLREGTWDLAAQRFDGREWSRPILLPDSAGRSDMQAAFAAGEGGRPWLAWASDGRGTPLLHHAVYTAAMPQGFPAKERLDLEPAAAGPAADAPALWQPRKRPVAVFGEEGYTLYQGDLRRYTELSPCHPFTHGSVRDVLRFALDSAQIDFMALDGLGSGAGAGEAYRRSLQHKLADLYSIDGSLVILCGYDCRTPGGGHGSVLCTEFGAPGPNSEKEIGAAWEALLADQSHEKGLSLLYGWATAEALGDRARGVDLVSPLEENAGGAGSPLELPDRRPAAWWLAASARAALVAGTGHHGVATRTHLWAGYLTRDRVLRALRLRRSYVGPASATIRFTASGKPIGSVVHSTGKPVELAASVSAGRPILRVELLRNGEEVERVDAEGAPDVELAYTHPGTTGADQSYALRVVCEDGSECWTTPIWVTDPKTAP